MRDKLMELLEVGFLTGSRAFGTARPDSDFDIVYSIEQSPKISAIIEGIEKYPSDYFAGYYVNIDSQQVNLIPVHPHEYLPWYLATKAMTASLTISGIDNPIDKYSVFSGMVSLFKATTKKRANLAAYMEVEKWIYDNEHGGPLPFIDSVTKNGLATLGLK